VFGTFAHALAGGATEWLDSDHSVNHLRIRLPYFVHLLQQVAVPDQTEIQTLVCRRCQRQ